ncbi:MAG TPA: oligopeptide/dipeptide ABC transporter ATP-binding protein [Polyangiales bacterium]|nr:oligopeptide/dipeptide ABC transporter ATP-binding protein [Polyangiales bacterium]
MSGEDLLVVEDLAVHFPVKSPGLFSRQKLSVRAVDGVSLRVPRGRTLGLVGESGCGKSTTGRAILQFIEPARGSVRFDGMELTSLWRTSFGTRRWGPELRDMRRRMQMIFQDPYACLNPRMTVEDIVAEPLKTFRSGDAAQIRKRVIELLMRVGMDPRYRARYPHEFSGGQRQRIGIARALALSPDLLICDEPISALDVSIQAQILNLLTELQREVGLSYVFIAHDLAAVRMLSDRIAVMYLGRIVEVGDRDAICVSPRHPYTRSLIQAVPIPNPKRERARVRLPLKGEVPSPLAPPSGCHFHPRCPLAVERCSRERPELREVAARQVACHRAEEVEALDAVQPVSR